ncbi:hypothetical protein OAO43_02420 [Candidatus Pelagibacter ubique]|nr:hypothetical protein [Candidatus Pelagibacter ubique]
MVENKEYKEIKKLIHEDNQDLLKFINKNEIEWLKKHFKFINSLLMGNIKREEKKYIQFVDNIQNKKIAKTEEEKIYLKFIDYFDYQIKKSKLETIDLNILYNGVEIYPAGTRPLGPDVDNRDREYDEDYW